MTELKLFIVHTSFNAYDEYDPFIVLARDAEEAEKIVMKSKEFIKIKEMRMRATGQMPWANGEVKAIYRPEDRPIKIERIEEISFDKARVIWAVYNPG